MTAEALVALVAAILALLFAYIPGFANWFNPLEAEKKRLIMLGLMVIASAAVFGLSCAGIQPTFTCSTTGIWELVKILGTAIIMNQSLFAILPKVGLNKSA